MAEYHVGCGNFGIYAGTLKKNGCEWLNKSKVTNEAINAVMEYMHMQIPEEENAFAFFTKTRSGKYLRLKLEVCDHCPEWLKEESDG